MLARKITSFFGSLEERAATTNCPARFTTEATVRVYRNCGSAPTRTGATSSAFFSYYRRDAFSKMRKSHPGERLLQKGDLSYRTKQDTCQTWALCHECCHVKTSNGLRTAPSHFEMFIGWFSAEEIMAEVFVSLQ